MLGTTMLHAAWLTSRVHARLPTSQCYRTNKPVPGARANLRYRQKYFYTRPGIETFIKTLVGGQ